MDKQVVIQDLKLDKNLIEFLMTKLSRFEDILADKAVYDADLRLFSEDETASLLNISKMTLQNLRKSGEIKYHQIGKRILYSRKNILDFHERCLVDNK